MKTRIIVFGVLYVLLSIGAGAESFPYHESFESGSGRWGPDESADFVWERNYGSTKSLNTGPSEAHDRDWYMYTEATGTVGGQTAILQTEFDISTLENPTFRFRYHMFGGSMGTVKFQVYTESYWQTQWVKGGIPSPHSSHDAPWTWKEIDLQAFAGSTNLMVRFHAVMGASFESDISIDDIWLYDNGVIPHHFVWSTIGDPQVKSQAFPVQIEAVDSQGRLLTSFTNAVELFAWSEGFVDACTNGDFNVHVENGWEPINGSFDSGQYRWLNSVYGSGNAFAFRPDVDEDGLQQEIFLRGGESYQILARAALRNSHTSADMTGQMTCEIKVDGISIGSFYLTYLPANTTYPSQYYNVFNLNKVYTIVGSFIPPEDGIYTLQLIGTSSSGKNSDLWVYFDDVSVNFAPPQYLFTNPERSGSFTNGVWNGTVAIDNRLPEINLIARYADILGESSSFTTYTSAGDADGDGILDSWEVQYFGSTDLCAPLVDDDGDGYSNADEYFIGTIPTNITSSLNLSAATSGNSECILTWYSVEGHTYDIEWTPNLVNHSFTNIVSHISHPQGCFTNDTNISGSQGYYRIKVR